MTRFCLDRRNRQTRYVRLTFSTASLNDTTEMIALPFEITMVKPTAGGGQTYQEERLQRRPKTSFLRSLDEVTAIKMKPGKDIYFMGGGRVAAALIDGGLVDELRLIVYPLIAGPGKALFATTAHRRMLELRKTQQLPDSRVSLVYAIG